MLSKVSLDEVCMHYFEKMSSTWLWPSLGDLRPSDSLTSHPWKKSCGRSCVLRLHTAVRTFTWTVRRWRRTV